MPEGEQSVVCGQIEQAMAALEAQRASLGDAVVEVALAPLRAQLAALAEARVTTRSEQKDILQTRLAAEPQR